MFVIAQLTYIMDRQNAPKSIKWVPLSTKKQPKCKNIAPFTHFLFKKFGV
ncbi:hypothetical protein HMPREF0670_02136 [Prevotella sp. oral taxon 317 str. F0108]|nr:hypothetical protein HMPREF0670_02136 [Prevotella sp. oral taxon 317 str. F0108]